MNTETAFPQTSYEDELRGHHLLSSRACGITVIVLVLLGVVLDYAVYPQNQMEFAIARGVTSLCILAALALLYTAAGQRHVAVITFTWLMFPQMMIAWMIYLTQGEVSLFYAGLILTIFAVGTLFPVGHWYTLCFGLLTLFLFLIACVVRAGGIQDGSQILYHATIIAFSVAASTVCTYYNEKVRRQLFALREQVAVQNRELANTNADLVQIKGQMLQQEKMAAIGTLAAGLLHEVNNPVNFCLMAIDIALEEPEATSNPSLGECLEDAKQGMKRVQHIVSDLKTFAYRKAGDEMAGNPFLFEKALNSAVRLVSHETKGIHIVRDLDADTLVRGDEAAIIGVLINLLGNAAMALRKSGAGRSDMEIAVSAQIDGDRLRIEVRDNGSGIAAANLGRVFEPFFTTREIGQGLGLGLSISYSVIERHGGRLLVESMEGLWTKMIFDLARAE